MRFKTNQTRKKLLSREIKKGQKIKYFHKIN